MASLRLLILCLPFLFLFHALAAGEEVACVTGVASVFPKYTPLILTGKREGKLVEVKDADGKLSMIRRRDLSVGMRCVVVRVQRSRLREGPGPDYRAGEIVSRGAAFRDLGGEDGWTRVRDSKGQTVWLNLDHVWSPIGKKVRMSFENDK